MPLQSTAARLRERRRVCGSRLGLHFACYYFWHWAVVCSTRLDISAGFATGCETENLEPRVDRGSAKPMAPPGEPHHAVVCQSCPSARIARSAPATPPLRTQFRQDKAQETPLVGRGTDAGPSSVPTSK